MEDGESIGRVVGGRDEPPAVVRFENGRVAVADENLRVDVLREQWSPREAGGRMLDRVGKDVGNPRAEVLCERQVEGAEVLLRCRRDRVALRSLRTAYADPEAVAFRFGGNRYWQRAGSGNISHASDQCMRSRMDAPRGFEPRLTESESVVLP